MPTPGELLVRAHTLIPYMHGADEVRLSDAADCLRDKQLPAAQRDHAYDIQEVHR